MHVLSQNTIGFTTVLYFLSDSPSATTYRAVPLSLQTSKVSHKDRCATAQCSVSSPAFFLARDLSCASRFCSLRCALYLRSASSRCSGDLCRIQPVLGWALQPQPKATYASFNAAFCFMPQPRPLPAILCGLSGMHGATRTIRYHTVCPCN